MIKINYYPLLPFLSYDNFYGSGNAYLYQDLTLLNDYNQLKNYINILSQQKSWQEFSSYIISNIKNANKKIAFKTKNDKNENLIGVKRKINNDKNIQDNKNSQEKKIIEKKDKINKKVENKISSKKNKKNKNSSLKIKNILKNRKKNKNFDENKDKSIKKGNEISIVIKIPKKKKNNNKIQSTECIYHGDDYEKTNNPINFMKYNYNYNEDIKQKKMYINDEKAIYNLPKIYGNNNFP